MDRTTFETMQGTLLTMQNKVNGLVSFLEKKEVKEISEEDISYIVTALQSIKAKADNIEMKL